MGLLRREASGQVEDSSKKPSKSILVEGSRATLALDKIWKVSHSSKHAEGGLYVDGIRYRDADDEDCIAEMESPPEVTIVADERSQKLSKYRMVTVRFDRPLLDLEKHRPDLVVWVHRQQLMPKAGEPVAAEPQGFASVKNGKHIHKFPTPFFEADQAEMPFALGDFKGRSYWVFRSVVYSTVEDLQPGEVKALALEGVNKTKALVARAVALAEQVEVIEHGGREPIPDDVKIFVWQRAQGQCVRCRRRELLEFDHVIPVTMGGSNTARNLQLLCQGCNRAKGGSLV